MEASRLLEADALLNQAVRSGKLDLSGSIGQSEDAGVAALKRLPFGVISLSLAKNALSKVPEVGGTARLQSLDLSENLLREVDLTAHNYAVMVNLALNRNHFVQFPSSIAMLSMLQTLDVSNNFLVALPESVGSLRSLQKLIARSNRLAVLPSALWLLPQLQNVDLSHNALVSIPSEVTQCNSLQRLILSHNPLASIPSALFTHESLVELDLAGTPVYTVHSQAAASLAQPLSPRVAPSSRRNTPVSPMGIPTIPSDFPASMRSPALAALASASPRASIAHLSPLNSPRSSFTPTPLELGTSAAEPHGWVDSPRGSLAGDAATNAVALRAEIATLREELERAEGSAVAGWEAERAGLAARLAAEMQGRREAEEALSVLLQRIGSDALSASAPSTDISDSTAAPIVGLTSPAGQWAAQAVLEAQRDAAERRFVSERRAREAAEQQLASTLKAVRETSSRSGKSVYWLSYERESRKQIKTLNEKLAADLELLKHQHFELVQKWDRAQTEMHEKAAEVIAVRMDCAQRIDAEQDLRVRLERSVRLAEERMSSLQEQIGRLQDEVDRSRAAETAALSKLRQAADLFEERRQQLVGEKAAAEALQRKAEERSAELERRLIDLDTLRQAMTGQAVRATQAADAIRNSQAEISAELTGALAFATSRSAAAEQAAAGIQERLDRQSVLHQAELQEALSRCTALSSALDQERSERSRLHFRLDEATQQVVKGQAALEVQERRAYLQRADSSEKLTAVRGSQAAAERRHAELLERVQKLESEHATAIAQAVDLANRVELYQIAEEEWGKQKLEAQIAASTRTALEQRAERAETAVEMLQRELFRKDVSAQQKGLTNVLRESSILTGVSPMRTRSPGSSISVSPRPSLSATKPPYTFATSPTSSPRPSFSGK